MSQGLKKETRCKGLRELKKQDEPESDTKPVAQEKLVKKEARCERKQPTENGEIGL